MLVHGLAEDVLRMLRDAAGTATQHGVGFRRTIGGHYLDRLLRAGLAVDFPHGIEQAGIHLGRFVAAPVPQEPVELVEHGLVVGAVHQVGGADRFLGMRMIELDGAGVAIGDRVLRRDRHRHRTAADCHAQGDLQGQAAAERAAEKPSLQCVTHSYGRSWLRCHRQRFAAKSCR